MKTVTSTLTSPRHGGSATFMSTFEPLLTPATYAGSEYGMSQPDKQRKWADVNGKSRRWSFSTPQQLKELRLHQSQSPLGGTDFGADVPGDDDNEATTAHRKPRKTRNVVKRAIHKIGKLKKREPAPPPIADTAPPKVGNLAIKPRVPSSSPDHLLSRTTQSARPALLPASLSLES